MTVVITAAIRSAARRLRRPARSSPRSRPSSLALASSSHAMIRSTSSWSPPKGLDGKVGSMSLCRWTVARGTRPVRACSRAHFSARCSAACRSRLARFLSALARLSCDSARRRRCRSWFRSNWTVRKPRVLGTGPSSSPRNWDSSESMASSSFHTSVVLKRSASFASNTSWTMPLLAKPPGPAYASPVSRACCTRVSFGGRISDGPAVGSTSPGWTAPRPRGKGRLSSGGSSCADTTARPVPSRETPG